jgi:hypothetical protein
VDEARLQEAARNAINEARPTSTNQWMQLMMSFAAAVASEEREARRAAEAELAQLKSAIESAGMFVNDYGHVMRSGEGHDQ